MKVHSLRSQKFTPFGVQSHGGFKASRNGCCYYYCYQFLAYMFVGDSARQDRSRTSAPSARFQLVLARLHAVFGLLRVPTALSHWHSCVGDWLALLASVSGPKCPPVS
jgi:hypothetical protein